MSANKTNTTSACKQFGAEENIVENNHVSPKSMEKRIRENLEPPQLTNVEPHTVTQSTDPRLFSKTYRNNKSSR